MLGAEISHGLYAAEARSHTSHGSTSSHHLMLGTLFNLSEIQILYTQKKMHLNLHQMWKWSSHCGSMVMNLTSIHEDAGLIPGLTWWVKDPALP